MNNLYPSKVSDDLLIVFGTRDNNLSYMRSIIIHTYNFMIRTYKDDTLANRKVFNDKGTRGLVIKLLN